MAEALPIPATESRRPRPDARAPGRLRGAPGPRRAVRAAGERGGRQRLGDVRRPLPDRVARPRLGASRLADVLAPWAGSRAGDMLPLRVLGAAHRLVLERQAPRLAMFFPSVGGSAPDDALGRGACYAAWVDALVGALRPAARAARPPAADQRPRAARPLWPAPCSSWLRRTTCRSGCTSWAPRRGSTCSPTRCGSPGPAGRSVRPARRVHLAGAWEGAPVPPADVGAAGGASASGCDLDPVDVTTTEGRLHLTSFVWPDQVERLERLRAAYQLARDGADHPGAQRPRRAPALAASRSRAGAGGLPLLDLVLPRRAQRAEAAARSSAGSVPSATLDLARGPRGPRVPRRLVRRLARRRAAVVAGSADAQAAHVTRAGEPVQYARLSGARPARDLAAAAPRRGACGDPVTWSGPAVALAVPEQDVGEQRDRERWSVRASSVAWCRWPRTLLGSRDRRRLRLRRQCDHRARALGGRSASESRACAETAATSGLGSIQRSGRRPGPPAPRPGSPACPTT